MNGAALILIDNQRDFLHPDGLLGRLGLTGFTAETLRNYVADTNRLLSLARRAGLPTVHVITELHESYDDAALAKKWRARGFDRESAALVAGSWGAGMMDGLDINDDDHVVVKKGHSAFQFTVLDRLLRNLDVRTVFLAGGAVGGCLSDTTHLGMSLGYELFVVKEAVYPPSDPDIVSLEADASLVSLTALDTIGFACLSNRQTGADRNRSALVVMDAQRCFLSQGGHAAQRGASREDLAQTCAAIGDTIEAARDGGQPVVFVSTVGSDDGAMMLTGALRPAIENLPRVGEPIDYASPVAPTRGEPQIVKYGPGAFTATPLDRYLRDRGVGEVFLAGGDASGVGSVGDTVRAGVGLGYEVLPVAGTFWASGGYLDRVLSNRASTVSLSRASQQLRTGSSE